MRTTGINLANITVALFISASALYGCGDTTPDLPVGESYANSALVVSAPMDNMQLVWDLVFEDVTGDDGSTASKAVTTYLVEQTAGSVEVIPGGSTIVDGVSITLDTRGLGPDAANAGFSVKGILADGTYSEETVSVLSPPRFLARTLQLNWGAVAGAEAYRLTQIDGDFPLFDQNPQLFTAEQRFVDIELPVHLVDWRYTLLLLEANVDGVWSEVGKQDLRGNPRLPSGLSSRVIGVYSDQDAFPTASTGSPDFYGVSVALSENGRYMAVGAVGESTGLDEQKTCPEETPECDLDDLTAFADRSGAVYIYDLETDSAVVLKSEANEPFSRYGSGVAFSDDGLTLAVAAFGDPGDGKGVYPNAAEPQSSPNTPESGAVYIYTNVDGAWLPEAYIKASNAEAGDAFGWRIKLSGDGNTLAVSAIAEDGGTAGETDNSATDSGSVYVYTRAEGVWSQNAYLKASNAEAGDGFGEALALSGDGAYLAVSSVVEGAAGNSMPGSGAVYMFARTDDGSWAETAILKASNAMIDDRFGFSLTLDATGQLLVVGSPLEDSLVDGFSRIDNGGSSDWNAGAAYLFRRSGSGVASSWQQNDFYFKASNSVQGVLFGKSVALSSDGKYLAVGAWGEASRAIGVDGNPNSDRVPGAGAVYVFSQAGSSDAWTEVAYVKAVTVDPFRFFGTQLDLALNGELLGVAANGIGPNLELRNDPGFVYLY